MQDAQTSDQRALADALLNGGRQPDARATTVPAEVALADVKARQEAYWQALGRAHTRLRDAVVSHAPAWAEQVTADHADALSRYQRAAGDLDSAHRDLVTTGSVLAMLRSDPAGLSVGTYRPAAHLSMATEPVTTALAARAHERESAPVTASADEVTV